MVAFRYRVSGMIHTTARVQQSPAEKHRLPAPLPGSTSLICTSTRHWGSHPAQPTLPKDILASRGKAGPPPPLSSPSFSLPTSPSPSLPHTTPSPQHSAAPRAAPAGRPLSGPAAPAPPGGSAGRCRPPAGPEPQTARPCGVGAHRQSGRAIKQTVQSHQADPLVSAGVAPPGAQLAQAQQHRAVSVPHVAIPPIPQPNPQPLMWVHR